MKCFVTGNSAVNVECGARVKDPSSARPDSAALATCVWAVSTPTRARTQHTVTTADVWGWEHKAQSCLKGEIIGLGHYLKQSFTGSIVLRPVKQSGELGPVWPELSPGPAVRFYSWQRVAFSGLQSDMIGIGVSAISVCGIINSQP